MLNLIWLVPALPLFGAVLLVLFGRRLREPMAGWLATVMVAGSFVVAVGAFFALRSHEEHSFTKILFSWIPVGSFKVDVGFLVDPLSMTMVLFVTGIGALIHLYSIGYMHGDKDFPKFFLYLNLFVFSMLVLVLGNNLLLTFVGWEGVGTCSYLLISFWFEKDENASAGKKAFITNRVGDWGFMIGIFVTFFAFGTITYAEFLPAAPALAASTASFIVLMLFVGATGKSAQLPLFIWLPDAMAGPTPVSALIHAATMVTAGVYVLCRVNPVIAASYDWVPTVIAWVGVLTALGAALIATSQMDIKKVLAYSTISQLGYMVLAVGVGAYWVAIFHMVTHAFFKACLFLGSGSVIHGMHGEQDMRRMGGLRKFMPITSATFIVSTLAISGVPPFAGFWSKDEITGFALKSSPVLYALATLTAALTAYYMGRVTIRTFFGKPKWPALNSGVVVGAAGRPGVNVGDSVEGTGDNAVDSDVAAEPDDVAALIAAGVMDADVQAFPEPVHADDLSAAYEPHESPWTMTVPLILLAVGAALGGLLALPIGGWQFLEHWLEPVFEHGNPTPTPYHGGTLIGLLATGALIAMVVLGASWALWVRSRIDVHRFEPAAFVRGLYYDLAVTRFMGGPGRQGAELLTTFDKAAIDGAVDGVGQATRWSAARVRYVQGGYVRAYALMLSIGAVVMVAYVLTTVMGWR